MLVSLEDLPEQIELIFTALGLGSKSINNSMNNSS